MCAHRVYKQPVPTKDSDYHCYTELALQRLMVSDRGRTEAFAEAIAEVVRSGDRVIDVGTGTGLLAMLAARAGALEVVGLDCADVADVAKRLVDANDLSDVVRVMRKGASDYRHPQPVDVIVSEWLGHCAFTEGMLPHVLACRDHNLRPGGRMLPSSVELLIAPVESAALYYDEGPGFWDRKIRGLDFSPLEAEEVRQAVSIKTLIGPDELLAPAQPLVTLDLATASPQDVWCSGQVRFAVERSAMLHGLGIWFRAQLSPSVWLDTGPHAPATHWQQSYLPLLPRHVEAGEILSLDYGLFEHPIDATELELDVTIAGTRLNFRLS